jgi:formate dehydrogenase subunit delta
MKEDTMLLMARQITQFFQAYPHEQAVAGVADHITKFWEPRMRRMLLDYAAQHSDQLHEITREAVGRLKK